MTFSRRARCIFIITLITALSAVAYNFIIGPFFKRWAEIDNEIIIKKIAIRKDLRLLKNRDLIIKEYNTYGPSIRGMSRVLGYIEDKSVSLGIRTANIKPRPVIQKVLYKEYVIELQIEGSFADLNRFISELVKPPLFITVKKFDLRTTEAPSLLKGTLILSKFTI